MGDRVSATGNLAWMIPFSAEQQHQQVAHLIDMSVWVSRRACTPWVVNSRLAAEPGSSIRRCSMCSILAQVGSKRRPEIPAQVTQVVQVAQVSREVAA